MSKKNNAGKTKKYWFLLTEKQLGKHKRTDVRLDTFPEGAACENTHVRKAASEGRVD